MKLSSNVMIFRLIYIFCVSICSSSYAQTNVESNADLNADIWKVKSEDVRLESLFYLFSDTKPTSDDLLKLSTLRPKNFQAENFGKYNVMIAGISNNSDHKQNVYFVNFIKDETRFFRIYENSIKEIIGVPYRFDAAKIELNPGMNTFVLMNKNNVMNYRSSVFGLSFLEENEFHLRMYQESHIYGVVYGVAFIFILYSVFSYLTWRKKYFLYYSFYGASSAFIFMMISGYYTFDFNQLYIASVLHTIFAMLFINDAIEIRKTSSMLTKCLYLTCGLIFTYTLFTYLFLKDPFTYLSIGFVPISFMLIASIVRYKQGYRPALLFISGFTAFSIGALTAALDQLYFNNSTLGLPALLGWAVELGFFTFAVSLKLKKSEKKALDQSAHAFDQLSKIVYPHQIEQIKSGIPLELTMPVNQSEACVISFDLIQSSKINHLKVRDFLRNLFRRCNEVMVENYDDRLLMSNAFRIKEMGDGFLCSVGYPFRSPSDNAANDAITLAYRFHQILIEESKILESNEPICCGIGIAIDSLQGFYPEGGTMEYDIFGRALVLATRYEKLRKVIMPNDAKQSVIICQKRVIISASRQLRSNFTEIELRAEQIQIRDDPLAEQVYIQYLGEDTSVAKIDYPNYLKLVD